MAGTVAKTNSGVPSNPLLSAKQRTWHDMDLLNGLAGFAVEHRTWLTPDNGAEHNLFKSCLRGVKELGKFGLLDAIATKPDKVADILSDHKDIQKVAVEFVWKKCAAKSPRVFFGILPTDPMAPVMKEMVTKARLLKACKGQMAAGSKLPEIPAFEVFFERTPPKAALATSTSPQAQLTAGGADKAKA